MSKRVTNQEIQLQIQRANDRALLADPKFQSWLLRYLNTAGILAPNYRADPVSSALAEGRRALGIEALTSLALADQDAVANLVGSLWRKPDAPEPQEEPDDRSDEQLER